MKKIIATLLVTLIALPVFCAYNRLGIPDSAEIRKDLAETWFEASLTSVRNNQAELYKNSIGEEFQVRLEENESTFNIFVSPHAKINVDVYSDTGVYSIEQDIYPGDAQGSVVVVRDKTNGKTLRIRYYFLKDADVYVQFTPHRKTALADMVIFGNYAAKGVPTGVPFQRFYSTSIEEVINLTQEKLPWNYVLVDTTYYHSILQMMGVIQEKLPGIIFTPDAMYDENQELVKVSTGKPFENNAELAEASGVYGSAAEGKTYLSSAGFVKWIADGLVEPIAGGHLKRQPLIQETVSVKDVGHQGILSQKYDLFFSLNWIRNLASAVISVYSGSTYLFNQSGVDVTINPFNCAISANGTENIVTFIENSGYTSGVLKSLLYVLAATEPGEFYFGAIRGTDRTVSPEVKAFNENVVFFPYFREDGKFDCGVFMNAREMSLDNFLTLYADDFIYLTRVKSSEQFYPQ